MQMQNQQSKHSPQIPYKSPRKGSLILAIIGFTFTLILLIVTGIAFLKTSATSPYTLLGSFFIIISAIFSFLQLSPIIFPPPSEPKTVVNNYYATSTSGDNSSHNALQDSSQGKPIFRYNMPLKDPHEYFGRVAARTTLLSRTANGGSTSKKISGGQRRMGKTWLMEYLQLVAPSHQNLGPRFRVGYLSATNPQCKTVAGFTMKALEVLKVPASHIQQSPVQLSQLGNAVVELKAQDIVPVLCMDEFEGFEDKQEFNQNFVEGLRAMTQDDGLVLITARKRRLADIIVDLTGQSSPLFNIIKQITLKPFTESEAETFIQDKSAQAGFNDQGESLLFQAMCHHL